MRLGWYCRPWGSDVMIASLWYCRTARRWPWRFSAWRRPRNAPQSIRPMGSRNWTDISLIWALVLLTSGTTARPKIVPLTHANVCSSAYSSVAAQALRETDRSLNVLPLFHGHGLGATLLASLAAGASVVCTPGCDVNRFFAWL